MQVFQCDAAEASVRCQDTRIDTMRWKSVVIWSLCAELQKGVLQQCLVMTKMVRLEKSSTVVSIPHSSVFTQPKVLMSRLSTVETRWLVVFIEQIKQHSFYSSVACNAQITIIKSPLDKNEVIHHTCFPSACEAAFPKAAVGLSGIAGVPKAQVTSETLQRLPLFLKSHWLYELLLLLIIVTWTKETPPKYYSPIQSTFTAMDFDRQSKDKVWKKCYWTTRFIHI